MNKRYDVIVIGAGIAGLAHAWSAARHGYRVAVIERSPFPRGASVRNFGMVWPIGQPEGELRQAALRSRDLWLEAAHLGGFWANSVGSVCLAVHDDELAVMREFMGAGESVGGCEMLAAEQVFRRCPAANRSRVIGGLFSPTEVNIDPRQAIAAMPGMLQQHHGVDFAFDTTVRAVGPGAVHTADGRSFTAEEQVVVCSGADIDALFPHAFNDQIAVRCKLQMLATAPQPAGWTMGPMVCSGPTLRHYAAFANCPTLPALSRRLDEHMPGLGRYGIHFMASTNSVGEIILGDSHEYGRAFSPGLSDEIERLILGGIRELIDLPDWSISRRWSGVYLKARQGSHVLMHPIDGVTLFNALGGAGMTLSFGLAERFWRERSSESSNLTPTRQAEATS